VNFRICNRSQKLSCEPYLNQKKAKTRKLGELSKTKMVKQPVQQPGKLAEEDAVRTAIKPITPQKSLPNQPLKITH
jgi:hypothetical protein